MATRAGRGRQHPSRWPSGRAHRAPVGRAHTTVVGKFHYGSRNNYVTPIDQKITQEIVIPPGMEIPSESATEVSRADAEASRKKEQSRSGAWRRSCSRSIWDDLESVCRGCRNHRLANGYTESSRAGRRDSRLRRRFWCRRRNHHPQVSSAASFPAEVLEEAQNAEPIIPAAEIRKRRDFRDLPIVTIDGETARDFDDAVLVRQLENGNYELQVHIADVAHYVTPDSALDQEARLRGTSVYFPDRAVPMLPLELSTDICSLRPQVDRLVLSCVMEMDHRGEIVGYELSEGVIRSAERMTYTAVNAVLEGDAEARKRYAAWFPDFELMRDLAMILNRKRERRGSIDFDLPEPIIEFDELGTDEEHHALGAQHRAPPDRRVHALGQRIRGALSREQTHRVALSHSRKTRRQAGLRLRSHRGDIRIFARRGPLPIHRVQLKTDRRANYGTGKRTREIEIPKEVHITPRMYQKLTEKIAGKPEERILSFLMLRSLKQARYSEENLGHFALAAHSYTHFTSPIRRYPDLIVHRILKEVLHDSAEKWEGDVPVGRGASASGEQRRRSVPEAPVLSEETQAVRPRRCRASRRHLRPGRSAAITAPSRSGPPEGGPIPLEELHDIAEESSQSERRADEAERELMEWKKVKFMQDRVGEEFDGLIISVTKFGFFVELTDLFVEGLVPLDTLDRRPIHLPRKHSRDHRPTHAQDLSPGTDAFACWSTVSTRWRRKSSSPYSRKSQATRSAKQSAARWPSVKSQSTRYRRCKFCRPRARRVQSFRRDVAQPGRALAWGARGRQFKSARPDQSF